MKYTLTAPNGKMLISVESSPVDKPEKENKYIFVRLYNSKYKDKNIGTGFLAFGQRVTASSKWKVISSHAAIALNLQDKFYGMSIIDGDPTLKIEQCSETHKYAQTPYAKTSSSALNKGFINDESVDLEKSTYHVYAFKCTTAEYNAAKEKIAKAFYKKNVVFDTAFAGINMTMYSIGRKIKELLKGERCKAEEASGVIHKYDADKHPSEDDMKTIKKICSTFCAYVLCTSIKKLGDYFAKPENQKAGKYVSPSDLANFPGAIDCFHGRFCDYEKDARAFVKEHPEFKKYI